MFNRNRLTGAAFAGAVCIVAFGCRSGGGAAPEGRSATAERAGVSPTDTTPIEASSATLYVNGMSCPNCAHNIDIVLAKVPGVTGTEIDLATGRVKVGLAESGAKPSPRELARAIENTGFTLARIDIP